MNRLLVTGIYGCIFFAAISSVVAEPLRQQAYIWQRAWNDSVRAAISQSKSNLDGYVPLAAEVSWEHERPQIAHVPVDWKALQKAGKPFGVALRIGAFKGPFENHGTVAESLAALATTLLKESGNAMELQIDFDCPTAKLNGYRIWVKMLRQRIAPVPLIITVLPSWLNSLDFDPLIKSTDGFILQVHSLERPNSTNGPLTLCDPIAARIAVGTAGKYGIPFRVALPTYGYLVAFDAAGKFIGISAEGPSKAWPANALLRTVRADAAELAGVVHEWTTTRPPNMTGIIWYRLPTAEDALNWRWPTLAAIINGSFPKADLQTRLQRTKPGLVELEIFNKGDADAVLPAQVTAQCAAAEIVAADAIAGYERLDMDAHQFILRATPPLELQRLAPGEGRIIGWLRLSADKEIEVHVTPYP